MNSSYEYRGEQASPKCLNDTNSNTCNISDHDISIDNKNVNCTNVNNVLNIIGLNCCGIKKMLNYLEFELMIRKYDILCLVEAKTDDIDIVKREGYET